jgi:S-DNA-T family DNA segregation ATPase FtsK/SpoIIIE
MPNKPKINWVTIGLPIIAAGLVITLMFLFSGTTGGLSYIMFLPFIVASFTASAISYRRQMQEYSTDRQARLDEFENEIHEKKKIIDSYKAEQLKILRLNDPTIQECTTLVREQALRLGERRPEDPDFLSFRIGIGKRNSQIIVPQIPIENRDPQYNPLYIEAEKIINQASVLEDAPILCDLKRVGTIGVVGPIQYLGQFGWSSAIHLLTHHWPAEVNIAAFCSFIEAKNWQWINDVQHKTTIFPKAVVEIRNNQSVKKSLSALEEELRRRKALLTGLRVIGSKEESSSRLPALIVIFDRVSDIYQHAAFSILLDEGRELGVYGIFLMDRVEDIPAECGAIILIDAGFLSYSITGPDQEPMIGVKVDQTTSNAIQDFARKLSEIKWLIPKQITDPPENVSLLELFPYPRLDDLPIEKWWGHDHPFGYLRAPIGKFSPTADLLFDLNDSDTAHGPHGLIGGMTGSGKSELLKSIILSLALTHHPYDLNFALIDYKGGGAFDEFHDLPHVVGVITDIQSHADYATRVIRSLYSEVKRRERVLMDAFAKFKLDKPHVDEYRTKLAVRIPLPRLVIIFDEFAEFQEQHPEESKKLINIARLGRSLGIHLILCTQDPTGKAVDQQVRDNSNFKICLKVKTPETSKALVGIPDAVRLHRGEAYFYVDGPQKFRVSYTGNNYKEPELGVVSNEVPSYKREYQKATVSEAKAITEEIIFQARKLGIPKPPAIWLDPLPELLPLHSLLKKTSHPISWNIDRWQPESYQLPRIPLGLLDNPSKQSQTVLSVKDNLLIFGPSGSGKSVALMSLAMSIVLMYSPKEAYIYCIDIGGRSLLRQLQQDNLPHLPKSGGVILGNDFERLNRLFKMLNAELGKRANQFHNVEEYNSLEANKKKVPYIFLFVDGLTNRFNSDNPGFADQLDLIMRSGPTYGIYVILTGNILRDVPDALQKDTTMIILQSVDRPSILAVAGKIPDTYQKKIDAGQEILPGRGLINTIPVLELQCAMPVTTNKEMLIEDVSSTIRNMSQNYKGDRPPDVDVLPSFVSITGLPHPGKFAEFVVGMSQESLEPVSLSLKEDGPVFMITALSSGLGKTSALHLWLSELARNSRPEELQLILIDFHSRNMPLFTHLKHLVKFEKDTTSHVKRREDLKSAAEWLSTEVQKRNKALGNSYWESPEKYYSENPTKKFNNIVVAIDDYATYASDKADGNQTLTDAILKGEDVGVRLFIAEDNAFMPNDELTRRAKQYACGLAFGGSEGLNTFNISRPPYGQKTSNLPPGRGYLIKRGKVEMIQAAAYWKSNEDPFTAMKARFAKR